MHQTITPEHVLAVDLAVVHEHVEWVLLALLTFGFVVAGLLIPLGPKGGLSLSRPCRPDTGPPLREKDSVRGKVAKNREKNRALDRAHAGLENQGPHG